MKNKVKVFLKKVSLKRKMRDYEKLEYEYLLRMTEIKGRITVLTHEKRMPTNKNRSEYFDKMIKDLEDMFEYYDEISKNVEYVKTNIKQELDELKGRKHV